MGHQHRDDLDEFRLRGGGMMVHARPCETMEVSSPPGPAGRDETRGGRVGHQHRPCETMEVYEMEVWKAQNDRARPWGSFLSAWPAGWMRDEEGMVGHQHRPSRDHGGLSI